MRTVAQASQVYGRQTFEARKISQYVELFQKLPLGSFFARGEPKEYAKPWLPAIWRDDHDYTDRNPLDSAGGFFTRGELAALQTCQADFNAGRISDHYFSQFIRKPKKTIAVQSIDLLHWTALAQHYNHGQRYPTRLLDVTTDALTALYFAVRAECDEDGFVAWDKIGSSNNNLSDLPDTATSGAYLDILSIKASDGGTDYKPRDDTLNFIRPPLPNRRSEAQRGAFIWARGPNQNYLRNGFVIRVPADAKQGLIEELDRLNYNESFLFPESIEL